MTEASVWKRRVALMAGVALLVAVPAALLLGLDDEEESPAPLELSSGEVDLPALGPAARDRGLDVSYRVPRGWSDAKESSAIRIRSDDRSAQIVIAAPAPASEADAVLDQALSAIRSGYDAVEIARGSGRQLGGLETRGAVVSASAEDTDLRILVAVAESGERTYLVEVFTVAGIAGERLREAQVALNSLEFGS